MNDARAAILNALRRSLGPSQPATGAQQTADREAPRAYVLPAVEGDLVERFVNRIAATGASVARVRTATEIPQAVLGFLDAHQLPPALVRSDEPMFVELSWPVELAVAVRAAADGDRTSLTGVLAAVAETGSLVVASARRSPHTLNFLAENHIVVVQVPQVVRHLEDVWLWVRNRPDGMPRALTFITGPSRTADVEQTIQIGAHGPRRLHVVLVEEPD